MADNSTRRRVKLYMLNDSRVWDDQGTGHVSSAYVEKFKGMSLLVRSETDGEPPANPTSDNVNDNGVEYNLFIFFFFTFNNYANGKSKELLTCQLCPVIRA